MTQVLEVNGRLTDDELEQVRAFADFLISRRAAGPPRATAPGADHKISFEGWAGSLAHVHPEMSDAEFARLMMDERVRGADE